MLWDVRAQTSPGSIQIAHLIMQEKARCDEATADTRLKPPTAALETPPSLLLLLRHLNHLPLAGTAEPDDQATPPYADAAMP